MHRFTRLPLFRGLLQLAGAVYALLAPFSASAQTATPTPIPTPPPVREDIVVSATRVPEIETEIPGAVTVIPGEQLRRENVRTLGEALQDVVGLDSGIGSDNGSRLANIGMWGLKEFDALL